MSFQSVMPQASSDNSGQYRPALITLTSLFFMWGFITCLNDILIPHLKELFSLSYAGVMFVQFCFFAAYFLVSLPAGVLVAKLGFKSGIIIGLLIAGSGCLLFYPAASLVNYPLFLGALFILASGITILQVAANPYVAALGSSENASSRLNLTQAFNSLGTTIAPLAGSYLILSNSAKEGTLSVQLPYIGLASAFFILSIIIFYSPLPGISSSTIEKEKDSGKTSFSLKHHPHLLFGTVAIFMYVGAEVSIGSFLVNYICSPLIGNMPLKEAGSYLSLYWGGAMIGRFIGSAILRKVQAGKLLAFNAAAAIILLITTIISSGHLAMFSALSIGLFNSIMFSNIFTLGIKGLGKHTGQGSGILCMAIIGGAIVPLAQGFVADRFTLQYAFIIPAICYGYIIFYGLRGHTIRINN